MVEYIWVTLSTKVSSSQNARGTRQLSIFFSVPDGTTKNANAALRRAGVPAVLRGRIRAVGVSARPRARVRAQAASGPSSGPFRARRGVTVNHTWYCVIYGMGVWFHSSGIHVMEGMGVWFFLG